VTNGRSILLGLLIGAVLAASIGFAAGGTTYGVFVDSETGGGTVRAADSFETPGDGACIDTNGDGQCGPGDIAVEADDLSSFDNASADLVVPDTVADVFEQNDDVSVTAASIRSAVGFDSQNGDVTLTATAGSIEVDGAVASQNGQVTLSAATDVSVDADVTTQNGDIAIESTGGGDITIDGRTLASQNGDLVVSTSGDLSGVGASLTSQSGAVSVSGGAVDLTDAVLYSKNVRVDVESGSALRATGAVFDSNSATFDLRSHGDLLLDDGSFATKNGAATAALGTDSATLSVAGLSIDDRDGVLGYAPPNVSVQGSPASGRVAAE